MAGHRLHGGQEGLDGGHEELPAPGKYHLRPAHAAHALRAHCGPRDTRTRDPRHLPATRQRPLARHFRQVEGQEPPRKSAREP